MRTYGIFLKKELIEAFKTYKLLIMGAVFLIFGIMSPLTAKMMPEILRWAMELDPSTAGIDLSFLFSNPTALDAWMQFYGNVGQIGVIILVIVFSGMLSSELSKGTLTIILTKGLTRSTVIISKLTSATLIWTGSLLIAFFTSWGYTIYFFPNDKLPYVLLGGFCLWLSGVFLLALTAFAASITKTSSIFCMLSVGAAVIVLNLLAIIPYVGKYSPVSLGSLPISLLAGASTARSIVPTLIASVIIIIALILLAVITFDRTKTLKFSAVIASVLAFAMLFNILLGEEVPARIKLNRYVTTEKITIGTGTEWELAGKLTLPKNIDGKIPAVVLVQGSGSSDMDETIFDNRPFKEIAEYLSTNGISVIRYNKRSYTHGFKMVGDDHSFTVWEETIEDAILAAEILKADPRIDENRVFILGHSLGGMLAPRIHAMGGDYAGIIIFAGSPRFLLDIMKDQGELALKSMPEGDEKEKATKDNNELIISIEEGILLPDEEAKRIVPEGMGGISAYYFKDLHENPLARYIVETTVPFLVMHAAEDLQVYTDKDFNAYKTLLADHSNATFKLYDGLNHLFMPARTDDIAKLFDEYRVKANIDEQVLSDIAEWIKAN